MKKIIINTVININKQVMLFDYLYFSNWEKKFLRITSFLNIKKVEKMIYIFIFLRHA